MDGRTPGTVQDYDYFAKVVLLGDAAVGKSSILLRFTQAEFREGYACTLGVDFQTKTLLIENKRIKLQVWDTAGQERFTPMTKCYLRNTHACIVAYDLTNRETFVKVKRWVREFQEANSVSQMSSLAIVGNKADCEKERAVTAKEGRAMAEDFGAMFFETSAKEGTNVEEVFGALAQAFFEKVKGRDSSDKGSTIRLKPSPQKGFKTKSSCC